MKQDPTLFESLVVFMFLGLSSFVVLNIFNIGPQVHSSYEAQSIRSSSLETLEAVDVPITTDPCRVAAIKGLGGLNQAAKSNPCDVVVADLDVSGGLSNFGFGSINISANSTKTFIVSYTGLSDTPGPATRVSFSIDKPEFTLSPSTCATTVSQSCTIKIIFTPTTAGIETATLTLSFYNGSKNETKKYTLQGTGVVVTGPLSQVLIVYNKDVPDSIAVKDYYIAHRPGGGAAKVFGVNAGPYNDEIHYSDFISKINDPIVQYMVSTYGKTGNTLSSTAPKYIELMYGVPWRFTTNDGYGKNSPTIRLSNLYDESQQIISQPQGSDYNWSFTQPLVTAYNPASYPATRAIVTVMNMGSVEATKAYIDKLANIYNHMQTPNAVLSCSNANLSGTTYYYDGVNVKLIGPSNFYQDRINFLHTYFPSAPVVNNHQIDQNNPYYLTTLSDVKSYSMFGVYRHIPWSDFGIPGYRTDNYATDGSIKFTGKSGCYIMSTVESYDGLPREKQSTFQWRESCTHWTDPNTGYYCNPINDTSCCSIGPMAQGNYEHWFAQNAFGSTNYENTPIGAIGFTWEPTINGTQFYGYDLFWEKGYNFADAAWAGARATPYFAVFGDAMVTK